MAMHAVTSGLVRAAALAGATMLGACTSTGSGGEGGNVVSNMLLYGGPTVPPAAPVDVIDVADCPTVDIGDGGAALRTVGGRSAEAGAVRSQISIANVARECAGQRDGSILVKVGVEGRALVGPGGGAGRFEAPVYIILKRGERILASRARRVAISVPAGDTQGSFVIVEDGLVVPPGIGGEFEIEVGLGTGPSAARAPARTRRARR